MDKNIVLIRFSSREFGNCAAIENEINNYYNYYDHENIYSYIVDSKIIAPCNDCDYECLQQMKACPNLSANQIEIMNAICNANLVYLIVPSYCGYPCANYFAFNERTVGYFNLNTELMQKYMDVPKRFIIISNSEGQNFLGAMQQQVNGEPDMLYLKSSRYEKKSIAGDIMDSSAARADLAAFLDRYIF